MLPTDPVSRVAVMPADRRQLAPTAVVRNPPGSVFRCFRRSIRAVVRSVIAQVGNVAAAHGTGHVIPVLERGHLADQPIELPDVAGRLEVYVHGHAPFG